MSLAILNARALTMDPGATGMPRPRMPALLGELGVRERAHVVVEGGRIVDVLDGSLAPPRTERTLDADGRVVMPGFVDCHTHACWAGDRLDEWQQRRAGAAYLDILRAGGGIMSTVRAVRAASERELADSLLARLMRMLREGTTTVEVKSGYGLTPDDEIKMLRAIRAAAGKFPGTVVPTALLGHAFDPEEVARRGEDGCVEWMIAEGLGAVNGEFPGIAVDAYCEKGAWSVEQCTRLFTAAARAGHPMRVHADQFNRLGMVERAVELGAASVDHLEASGPDEMKALAASAGSFGVMLPICGLHADGRFADARKFLAVAPTARLAVASNFNPGSAPSGSMPLTIAMAVRGCGLTPGEAIACATVNPACLLGFRDRGVIAAGMRADLVLLRHTDERMLAFELGGSAVDAVICGGRLVGAPPGV